MSLFRRIKGSSSKQNSDSPPPPESDMGATVLIGFGLVSVDGAASGASGC